MIYLQLAFTEGNTFRGCLSVPKTFSHSSFDNGWLKSQDTDIGRGIDLSLRWFITEDLKHIGDLRHDASLTTWMWMSCPIDMTPFKSKWEGTEIRIFKTLEKIKAFNLRGNVCNRNM